MSDNEMERAVDHEISSYAFGFLFGSYLPEILLVVIGALIFVAIKLEIVGIVNVLCALGFYLVLAISLIIIFVQLVKYREKFRFITKCLSLAYILCLVFLAAAPTRISNSSLVVSKPAVFGVFAAAAVIIGILNQLICSKKIFLKLLGAIGLAAAIGFTVFSSLWSIGCKYENMDSKEIEYSLSTYSVNFDFRLYEKRTNKANSNECLGTYPAGTVVMKKNTLFSDCKLKRISDENVDDEIVLFLGKVKVVSDGKIGYIAVFGSDVKSEEDEQEAYLNLNSQVTEKENYMNQYHNCMQKAVALYDRYDFLGCKSYERRAEEKKRLEEEPIKK